MDRARISDLVVPADDAVAVLLRRISGKFKQRGVARLQHNSTSRSEILSLA